MVDVTNAAGEVAQVQSGQVMMLVVAGVALVLGAVAVFGISTKKQNA